MYLCGCWLVVATAGVPVVGLVKKLAHDALSEDITLLCVEEDAQFCHRRVLAEICVVFEEKLNVEHR